MPPSVDGTLFNANRPEHHHELSRDGCSDQVAKLSFCKLELDICQLIQLDIAASFQNPTMRNGITLFRGNIWNVDFGQAITIAK